MTEKYYNLFNWQDLTFSGSFLRIILQIMKLKYVEINLVKVLKLIPCEATIWTLKSFDVLTLSLIHYITFLKMS